MATIIQSVASEKAAEMTNSTWARPIAIPSNWTKLRVGVRCRCNDLGFGPSGTPRFAVGLSNGTTNIIGDASATHFVGVITDTVTWQYSGGTNGVYFGISPKPYKQVNGVDTFGTALSADARLQFLATNTSCCFWFIEIIKGSPNYTFNIFANIAAVVGGGGPTAGQFLSNLQAAAGGCVQTSHAYGTSQTLAVNEGANGTLNAVNVWWNQAAFFIDLYDVGIALIA